jgi:hypothetical protein
MASSTSITRKWNAQRTATTVKRLQEAQSNAELASGALVSSAASSRVTGSRLIAQIPMAAERVNRTAVLFGRTLSENDQVQIREITILNAYQPRPVKATATTV